MKKSFNKKRQKKKKVQLHLGCGERYIPGFIHIDARRFSYLDYVSSVAQLKMFSDNSVDLIYACHVLEHFRRNQIEKVLKEWHRILKNGGILRLAVPDFDNLVRVYLKTKNLNLILGPLCGRQDYPENTHFVVFNFASLKDELKKAGFRNVRYYDWQKTIHKKFDDYSQAYIPHMDKKNGILISLNVEAKK